MAKRINLNEAWTFEKGINDKQTFHPITVDLPHTWNAIDGANGFDFYRAKSRYQRTFMLAEQDQGRRIYIECEGANSVTEVFVNGMNVGKHEGGYSTFRFDVTDVVSFTEENTLIFEVDNRHREDIYPLMADFTFYGGVYRDVNLVVADALHFDLLDHGSSGVYLFQEDVTDESATVRIDMRLVNESEETSEARLWIDVTDQAGQSVYRRGKEVTLTSGVTTETIKLTIDDPMLWHGVKDPHLYSISVRVETFNDTVDEVVLPLGLRYYHVDPEKGFFLNGEPYPLRGVSRHQDRKDMGWAITEAEHDEDMASFVKSGRIRFA
ncbi:glycoside hydrolase family 2 protein [Halolactibacillus sp. JCM 19043]|uniref:glycoside hydrolase family 2 protein n=1 Tax=Halolactibacillus sp. JCM 19043 TaxID=1460638 RepID=UPI000AD082D4|nr:sugar-binding domain-containing protein [Halolactibacillus sp. JCM 19043]